MSWPAMSGAEPWIGSYSPNVPCSVRRSPSEADGSIPRLPASTAASSDRMSPNRFSVTMTSKSAGRRTSSIAHESTSWWLSLTSGNSAATSSATVRHRRDVARTFALSTWVTCPRASAASSNASRTIRADLALGVRQRVERGRAAGLARRLAPVAEVDAAGELADDEHVDAFEQLRPQRRGRDERRMDGDRAQVREQPEPAAQREERLLRADGRRRIGPLRAADRAEQDRVGRAARLDVLGPDRDAIGVDRGAAGEDARTSRRRTRTAPGGVDDAPRGLHDLRPDPVPGMVAMW